MSESRIRFASTMWTPPWDMRLPAELQCAVSEALYARDLMEVRSRGHARRHSPCRARLAAADATLAAIRDGSLTGRAAKRRAEAAERRYETIDYCARRERERERKRKLPKFPVLTNGHVWPEVRGQRKAPCPMCGKAFTRHALAMIGGGAMKVTDWPNECAEMFKPREASGFLYFFGREQGSEVFVHLAEWVQSGQYDLNLCSTRCLRAFLKAAVDELEAKIAKAAKRTAAKRTAANVARTPTR